MCLASTRSDYLAVLGGGGSSFRVCWLTAAGLLQFEYDILNFPLLTIDCYLLVSTASVHPLIAICPSFTSYHYLILLRTLNPEPHTVRRRALCGFVWSGLRGGDIECPELNLGWFRGFGIGV